MLLLTFRDLQYRALRFVVVTVGVAVVMTMLFLMTGLVEQFNREPFDAVDAIGADTWVVPGGVDGPFTASALLSPESEEQVEGPGAAPLLVARGALNAAGQSQNAVVIGHVVGGTGSPEPIAGRAANGPGEAVIDSISGVEVGDSVVLGDKPLTVVGVHDTATVLAGLPLVFVPIDEARAALFDGRAVTSAVVLSGDPTSAPDDVNVISADTVANDALGPLEGAIGSVSLIRILLWIVAAIIIGAVVYLSALERSRDFAVLKAMGVGSRDLVLSIGLQAVLIALSAVLLAALLQALIEPIFPLRVRVPTRAFWQIPIAAVVVAILAGLGGMRRVTSSDPAAAFSGPGA